MAHQQQSTSLLPPEARQTLMGPGQGQFNLALARARATELRASLRDVHEALLSRAQLLQWEAVLQKFATINLQVMALREQLRSVLRVVVVHPRLVDDPALAQALPIQLASRVTPEMEAEEASALARESAALDAQGIAPSSRYETADAALEDFNKLVGELAAGPLHPQSELRQEITASSRAVGKAIAQAKQAAAGAQAKAGGQAGGQPLAAALRLGAPASLQVAKRQKAEVPALDPALMLLLKGPTSKAQQGAVRR